MNKVIDLKEFEWVRHLTCAECESDAWFIVIERPESVEEFSCTCSVPSAAID